jgi:hypothetical protein
MRGIDLIKNQYITENELSELLNVDAKRIRDLRSNHITGKREFIDHIKPTSKSILYKLENVFKYLENQTIHSFGKKNQINSKPILD